MGQEDFTGAEGRVALLQAGKVPAGKTILSAENISAKGVRIWCAHGS